MKGNCKFGAKCALAHILPDGRRVNRSDLDVGIPMNGVARPYNIGPRIELPPYHGPDPALINPIPVQPPYQPELYANHYPYQDPDDIDTFSERYPQYPTTGLDDPGLGSPPPQFGSPPDEPPLSRPTANLHTALNAPLPQSFDSNGISHIAKYGPLGQSVPDKFGLRSPAASLPNKRPLQSDIDATGRSSRTGDLITYKPSSPLSSSLQTQEDAPSQRILHSQRTVKQRVLSASVPKLGAMDEWEDRFRLDTDHLLPNSLHGEVLTPQERMRRLSRPEHDGSLPKDKSNPLAIPSSNSSKVGSPSAAGSPSRFRALWEEQREKKGDISNTVLGAFGHVGSPLRESWMPNEESAPSGPPRELSSISGISQQLTRMHLSRLESGDLNGARIGSSGLRHASAPISKSEKPVPSPGLQARKVDEDGEGVFFPMDDENNKRSSMNWSSKSPNLDPLQESDSVPVNRSTSGLRPVFGFQQR